MGDETGKGTEREKKEEPAAAAPAPSAETTPTPVAEAPPQDGATPAAAPETPNGLPAAQPIELTGKAPKHEVNAFKKLFFKIGEKLSTTKQSPFPPEYISTVSEIDVYKIAIVQLLTTMTKLVQQHPHFNDNIDRKTLEAPPNLDPFDVLYQKLSKYSEFSHNKKVIEQLGKASKKWADVHRKYQETARRAFHYTRTFLKVDVPDITEARAKVMMLRQQYDYVKYEHENNPVDSLARELKKARTAYDDGMQAVVKMAKKMKDDQEEHRVELAQFLGIFRDYNASIAAELAKQNYILDKISSFADIQAKGLPPNPSNSSKS